MKKMLKRGERVSHVDIWGKNTLGEGNSMCKGSEVRECLEFAGTAWSPLWLEQ